MFTPTITGTDVDKAVGRRIVYVTFTDGAENIQKSFSIALTATLEDVKRVIASAKNELDNAALNVPTGVIDTTPIVVDPAAPTQAELDKTVWQNDRAKLKELMELVRDGVFTGTETQITTLQAKVKAEFKAAYL